MNRNIAILLIALSIFCMVMSISTCNKYKDKSESLSKSLNFNDSLHNTVVKHYEDELGSIHNVVESITLKNEELSAYTKGLEKELGVKSSQIASLTKVISNTHFHGDLRVDTVYKDSIQIDSNIACLKFYKDDKWYKIRGTIGECGNEFTLESWDTLQRVEYSKRKWFLAPKKNYIDISNKNPNTKVVSITELEVSKKQTSFTLGPTVGIGFTDLTTIPRVFIGIGLQYQPLTIKIR